MHIRHSERSKIAENKFFSEQSLERKRSPSHITLLSSEMSDLNYLNTSWHQPTTFYLSLGAIDHTAAIPRELLIFTLSGLPLLIALGIVLTLFLAASALAISVLIDGVRYRVGQFLRLVRKFERTSKPAPIELPALRAQERIESSGKYPAPEPKELPAVRIGNRSERSGLYLAIEPIELSTEGAINHPVDLRQDSTPSPINASTESEGGWSDVSNRDLTPEPTES